MNNSSEWKQNHSDMKIQCRTFFQLNFKIRGTNVTRVNGNARILEEELKISNLISRRSRYERKRRLSERATLARTKIKTTSQLKKADVSLPEGCSNEISQSNTTSLKGADKIVKQEKLNRNNGVMP